MHKITETKPSNYQSKKNLLVQGHRCFKTFTVPIKLSFSGLLPYAAVFM